MYDRTIRHESAFARRFAASVIRRLLIGLALPAIPIAATASTSDSDPSTFLSDHPVQFARRTVGNGAGDSAPAQLRRAHEKTTSGVRVPHGQPVLAFDATNLDFGATAIGDSSGWQMTMLNNTGTADATDLQFSADPGFALPPSQNGLPCYGWTVLPAGGTCLVVVKFAPASSGPASGMLNVSSAEGAGASLSLAGVGREESVLYAQFHDWVTQEGLTGLLDTHYVSEPARDSELADDFEVGAGGWVVNAVGVEMVVPGRPAPPPVDIYFMSDANGVPGDTPVCTASNSQITLWEPPLDESRVVVELSSSCALAPGHYWLRIVPTVATRNDSLFWGLQFTRPSAGDPLPIHLSAPTWRNPGGGAGYPGCFDWTPVVPANCSLEEYSDTSFYGSVFWIIGREFAVDAIFANGFEVSRSPVEGHHLPR